MKSILFFGAFLLLSTCCNVHGEGGFIFTAPGKLQMGADESVCLQLSNFDEDVYVSFRLIDNVTVLATATHTFLQGQSGCVDLTIPVIPERENYYKKDVLEVVGVGQTTDERFTGKTEVSLVERDPGMIFIQTDKPLYKPGQLVRIRVLVVNQELRPITTPISLILRNPMSVKLAHWKDQESEYGLLDFDFQLSAEPVMGTWVLEAEMGGKKYPTSFKVEEYVLPKYEVTVTPPSYLNPWTSVIEGKVCAKYTYGKPVVGRLRVEVCLESGGYYYRYDSDSGSNNNRGCTQFIGDISGCQDFSVNATLIGLPFNTYNLWSAKVIYNASVEEEATGVTLYGSSRTEKIERSEVNIKFEDISEYFKPGLPFSGKIVVSRPDSTLAPNEPVRLSARNYQTYLHYERNYTTNVFGEIYFSLPVDASEKSFSLQASAIRYERGSFSFPENYHTVSESTAYHYVRPWYSPSNSFVEITPIEKEVECGHDIPVEITYTTPEGSNYRFYYQIISRGNIVVMDSIENDFEGSEFVPVESEEESWTRITTPVPPTPTVGPNVTLTVNITEPEVMSVDSFEDSSESSEEEEGNIRRKRNADPGEGESDRVARFSFKIPLQSSMSSGGKLMVYYIREDEEVVADHTEFEAGNCVDNQVNMKFTESPVAPGEPATLKVSASPGSLCGIGVVDKSILLLGGNNQLTVEKVINTLNQANPMRYFYGYLDSKESNKYCLDTVGIPEKFQDEVNETMMRLSYESWWDLPFTYQLEQTDSYESFLKMGFVVATNLDILTRPCKVSERTFYRGLRRKGESGGIAAEIEGLEPVAFAAPGAPGLARSSAPDDVTVEAEAPKARTYFPETWLWDIEKVGPDGVIEVKRPIPDTITEWVGSTVCTNTETGLGVSNTAKVTAFQAFFSSYTLPYSVIRGERIPIPVTIFNYMEDCLAVQLNLDISRGGFDLDGDETVTICVCGQQSETHRYYITPNTIGEVNITVDARSVTDNGYCSNSFDMSSEGIGVRDIMTRQLLVESEGIPEEYTRSYFICPSEEKRVEEKIPLLLPDGAILDSARAYVNIIGDLMGSALTNLDNLVRMPYGCGEQNMASFTPNIYVMQYLQSTNRLTPEIEQKALNYMKIGYQRELRYRHADGSYSSFGPGTSYTGVQYNGSSWLTAFVVKSLAQARPYIYIDQEDLDKSINFFKKSQDNVTGCFPRIGQASAYLKGGNEGQANSTLTAYILAAMLEADTSSQDPSVREAVRCIEEDNFSDIYTTALAAYALTLYDEDHSFRHTLLERLQAAVIKEEGQQHWERKDKPEDTKQRPWWWWRPASSAEVEMTAYALMAFMAKDEQQAIVIGQPIVQWLSRQRNAYGGFSSTQDTVVALQALAEYGSIAYSDGLDLSLTLRDDEQQDLLSVLITDSQSLIPKKQRIETLPTEVTVSASGVGCALVQANVRYNVEGETPKEPAFEIDVTLYSSVMEPKNCDRQRMQVCTRFTVPAQMSNMAIIEVKMVTGWVPDESGLKSLVAQPNSGVRRYEIDNNIVNFYFDQITGSKSCVFFEITKELTVNNTQPGRVHVYDYYESDYSVFTEYEIDPQCNDNRWYPILYDDVLRVEARSDFVAPPMLYDTCPACLEKKPDDFVDLFCNSSVAYKVVTGRDGDYSMKVLANFRTAPKKTVLNQFANYKLDDSCTCSVVEESTKVFIFGEEMIYDPEAQEITLDGRATIFALEDGVDKTLSQSVTKCS